MAIKAGLVGLPNVGKSTLFNALTKSNVLAANYPFATIDPHVAITNVPDSRLDQLAKMFGSQKIIPTAVQFVDIAGLVKGAAKGEGLGNQFLSNIMGVDLILHILRVFDDSTVTHVHKTIDPLEDFNVIMTELMLKDLDSVEKREQKLALCFKAAGNKTHVTAQQAKAWHDEQAYTTLIKDALGKGDWKSVQKHVRKATQENVELVPLLSGKNFLIIANISEDEFTLNTYQNNTSFQTLINTFGVDRVIPVSAKIEAELAQLSQEEAAEFMQALGITKRGLDAIIKQSYADLNLITFFTCGPKEAHAWSIMQGTSIQNAAGEIHTDLQRGFICAEVYNCQDLFSLGSEAQVKAGGKMRIEGKEYPVQDGDIVHVRFNV